MTDFLTTRGTRGPAHPPTDQTQWPQLGPFCPWSPPDVDDWPECPDWVRNKRFCWLLSPSLSLSSFQPLLSYPFFLLSWSWMQESCGRASVWSEGQSLITSCGQRTRILVLVQYLVSDRAEFPSSLPRSPGKSPITPGCLQVARDICKATLFVPPPSPLTWPPFPPLKSLKTWDISIYSVSTQIWSSVSL